MNPLYTVKLLNSDNILFFISGYLIRNLIKNIDCQDRAKSMVQLAASTDHQYSATPNPIFLNHKNMGDLIQASYGSYKVITATDKAFKLHFIKTNKKCTKTRTLVQKM